MVYSRVLRLLFLQSVDNLFQHRDRNVSRRALAWALAGKLRDSPQDPLDGLIQGHSIEGGGEGTSESPRRVSSFPRWRCY